MIAKRLECLHMKKFVFHELLFAGLWQCRETKVVCDKDVHDPAEVVEGVHVNGADVVVSRMPYGREWIRDEMHDLDAASHERQMIVFDVDSLHVSGLAKTKKGHCLHRLPWSPSFMMQR